MILRIIFLTFFLASTSSYLIVDNFVHTSEQSYRLNINVREAKVLRPSIKVLSYVSSINSSLKKKIFQEKKNENIKVIAEFKNDLDALIEQKNYFKSIKRSQIPDKLTIQKEVVKLPELISQTQKQRKIDAPSTRFTHYGYQIGKTIRPLDLQKIALNIIKDKYFDDKERIAAKKEVSERIVSYKSQEVAPEPKILRKKKQDVLRDEVVYRFSSNETQARKDLRNPLSEKTLKYPDEVKEESKRIDDLVFFDYSQEEKSNSVENVDKLKPEAEKPEAEKPVKKIISSTIQRPVQPPSSVGVKNNKKPDYSRVMDSQRPSVQQPGDRVVSSEYSKETSIAYAKSSLPSSITFDGRVEVSTLQISTANENISVDLPFDLIFEDTEESYSSTSEGIIVIDDYKLRSRIANRRFRLVNNEFITTVGHLNLYKDKEKLYEIPMISRQFWYEFIDGQGVDENSGAALFRLDENEDVILKGHKGGIYYFDSNFNYTENESEYHYKLFSDLLAGNTVFEYLEDDKLTFKEVHVTTKEVYFDEVSIVNIERYQLRLFEKTVLGSINYPLDVESKNIYQLYSYLELDKKSINSYVLQNFYLPEGERFNFHLANSSDINIGSQSLVSELKVPSQELKREYLNQLDIDKLSNTCVVQLDLPQGSELIDLEFSGESVRPESDRAYSEKMDLEMSSLSSDGKFYGDITDESTSIFFIGYAQGIMSIKLSYANESVDYLNFFCDSDYSLEFLE